MLKASMWKLLYSDKN